MDKPAFTLPNLNYEYGDLAPYISKDVMELHHSKHHQTYVDKFNAVVATNPSLQNRDLNDIISRVDEVDASIKQSVINFGGGHYNHAIFWTFLAPNTGGEPNGELKSALEAKYGSFQAFVDEFTKTSLGVFGSGWSWLMPDLTIATSSNQDTPLMHGKPEPILGLDVWEHAYYLDYKNKRDDYVRAWWNVVNWPYVAEKFSKS